MSALFVDTFFWVAMTDVRDASHEAAILFMEEHEGASLITTDEVLVEYLTYFAAARTDLRREAAAVAANLLENPAVRVFPQSRESFLAGHSLYVERPDKRYSLVDCISMQTMRAEGISDVLTNDRHFEQEGFRALFR